MCSEESFEDILTRLSTLVDAEGRHNIINVDRADILDGAFRGFMKPTFNPSRLLNVRFAGEDGIDSGGLTREFLRLAVSALKNSRIFTGNENACNIALDYKGMLLIYSYQAVNVH